MDFLIMLLLLLGSFFVVIASVGIVRMPDLYTRMHSATKAGTVGLSLLLLALAFAIPEISVISRVLGTILFVFLTAPVAAHILGLAMKQTGYKIWRKEK